MNYIKSAMKGSVINEKETYLVFVQVEVAYQDSGYHRKQVGLNHLAFAVENRERIDALKQSLLELGVRELYPELYPFAGGPIIMPSFVRIQTALKLKIP